MDADEFRDYILGFIFYKYLSEKMIIFANQELKEDGFQYTDIKEDSEEEQDYLAEIKEAAIESLGYFLKPSELSIPSPVIMPFQREFYRVLRPEKLYHQLKIHSTLCRVN